MCDGMCSVWLLKKVRQYFYYQTRICFGYKFNIGRHIITYEYVIVMLMTFIIRFNKQRTIKVHVNMKGCVTY